MQPTNLRFGGGVPYTVLNPVVAVAVLIAGTLICCLPRNKAIVPFLVASILIPTDQILLVGSLHFSMQRILILFGLIRLFRTKAASQCRLFNGGMNKIDVAIIAMEVFLALGAVLLWQQSAALIYQVGELYTVFGTYFLLRFFIRDQEDIERAIRAFAYIAAAVAVVMIYEQAKGWNPYVLLEGARAPGYVSAMVRNGRFRAEGCFAQPVLAGTFGAIVLPLFVGLRWTKRKHPGTAMLGIAAATAIVIASNSSTPVLAYLAGLLGLLMWSLRKQMRLIRWGIVFSLVSLHLVMKSPVWHLITRVDISGGSSSYHRYQLVDRFIRHFSDWWLVGTKSNAAWGWDMWDTANQYVGIGERSGLIPFILFLAIIVLGFKYLGKARRVATKKKEALFLWSLSAALFANVVAFFGISYFDQTTVAWYALLAVISTAAGSRHNEKATLPQFQTTGESPTPPPDFAPQDTCIPDGSIYALDES